MGENLCISLLHLSYNLLQYSERTYPRARPWPLLPLGSHQTGFFRLDTRTLYLLVRRARIANRNNPAPLILLAEGGSPLSISRCRQLESNPLWCQELWETVFDTDHIKPNRRRYGQDYQNPFAYNALSFKHTATTDGCMVHVQFEKFIGNSPELFPSTHDEIRRLPEGQDLTIWSHGVYRLELNPDGLTQQRAEESRIVGVDPGVSSMITGVSTAEVVLKKSI
ncbi:hypothetical protein BDB00DRAFT_532157 [Zychaea mexicana]|uniref:uncharacterized protein n=1 Tax=Zychaea mexicana TaxID=64656 RepID=UPI0022FE7F52|nr:uncharacterized protein BDB00DRAFT_532157 [Zychaea mexicana]KAI9490697.1 hypothetical protein BDB00DRAFT_532157 [Zychaea mexicana]